MNSIDPEQLVRGAQQACQDVEMLAPYEQHNMSPRVFARECTKKMSRKVYDNNIERMEYIKQMAQSQLDAMKLVRAATYNDVGKVKNMLKTSRVDCNFKDVHGRTLLHVAASRGYADIVKVLLRAGARANVVDNLGNTPLHLAVYTDSIRTVNHLISGGCIIRKTDKLPYTPLELAQSKLALLMKHQDKTALNRQQEIVDTLQRARTNELTTALAARVEVQELLEGVAEIALNE